MATDWSVLKWFDAVKLELLQPYRLGSGHCASVHSVDIRKEFMLPSALKVLSLWSCFQEVGRPHVGQTQLHVLRPTVASVCSLLCCQRITWYIKVPVVQLLRAVHMASRRGLTH